MIVKPSIILSLLLAVICAPGHTKQYPTVKFNADLMLDYDKFDANFLESSEEGDSQLDLRRLRFGLKSDITKDWSAKIRVDAVDDFEIKDAYLEYDGWDVAKITIGKQKEPFGLERLMGYKDVFMIERAMISRAISPERSYGINMSGKLHTVNWQLGYFQDDTYNKSNAVTGRLAWSPWKKDKNFIHLGAAFSERSLHDQIYRINQKLEVYGADSLIEGTSFNADSVSKKEVEFMWQYHGFVNIAEWQHSYFTASNGDSYQYEGGYYQISYLLSGTNRKYKNGMLGGTKTSNDWEISMRYSQLSLLEENSEAKVLSMGVNYLLNDDIKFMADYITADYLDTGEDQGSGNAISLRVQYQF